MQELIVQSRITPKKGPGNIVSRAALINEIGKNIDKNLILVVAPAGYGKTTLVQDFLANHLKPFAWFHVTPDTGNFYTFITYIVHSLRLLNKDFGQNTLTAIESLKQSMSLSAEMSNIITISCSTLLNDFSQTFSDETFLVLDDLHDVQNAEWFRPAFDNIIENIPANLHLLITTREVPAFNIAKYASKRNMLTIDAKKLRFKKNEIAELLKEVYSIHNTNGETEMLEKQLNGWITGIHLVLQSLGSNFKNADLSAPREEIFSFFAGEIFDKLEPELKEFLLNTCYLDNFTTEICDAILGSSSRSKIDKLISRNIFIETASVQSADSGKTTVTYSYHKLFKEFLAAKLHEEKSEDDIKETIKRIYEYYISTGNTDYAITLSLFSSSFDTAISLLKTIFDSRLADNQFELLWKWLESIPEEYFARDALLLYFRGVILGSYKSDYKASLGNFNASLRLVEVNKKEELYYFLLIKQAEALQHDRPHESLEILSNISADNTGPEIKAQILYSLAYAYYRLGPENYDKVLKTVDEGIEICTTGNIEKFLVKFCNLSGLIYSHKGEFINSIYYYEQVLRQEEFVIERMRVINNIIPLYVWSGNYSKAKIYLDESESLYNSFPSLLIKRRLLRTKALFYFEFGDLEESVSMFEQLIELEMKNNIKSFMFWNYCLLGEAFFVMGKYELAGKYYDIAERNMDLGHEYQKLELDLHRAILNKKEKPDKKVEATLLGVNEYFTGRGLVYAKAQIEFHLADYYFKTGQKDTALKFLRDSLKTSEEMQYISYLEQLYPEFRYLFDFALSNNTGREFIKSITAGIIAKSEIPWISEEMKARLDKEIPCLYDIFMKAFGGIEIMVRGIPVEEDVWIRKKSKLILTYLLLNPEMKFTKDKILGEFFRELSADSAENVFHQSITNIRNALRPGQSPEKKPAAKGKTKAAKPAAKKEEAAPDFILYEDKVLRLNPNYYYKVDAVEFNELYHRVKSFETKTDDKIKAAARAVSLYRGELLAGQYDDWCEELRTNYANKFTDLCEEMIAFFKERGKYQEVIHYSDKLIQQDRLHEDAYLNYIEASVKSGSYNSARAKFTQLLKAYDEEYGEKPPKNILNRIQELLSSE